MKEIPKMVLRGLLEFGSKMLNNLSEIMEDEKGSEEDENSFHKKSKGKS